jgi:hypothetical protein
MNRELWREGAKVNGLRTHWHDPGRGEIPSQLVLNRSGSRAVLDMACTDSKCCFLMLKRKILEDAEPTMVLGGTFDPSYLCHWWRNYYCKRRCLLPCL